jgi:HEAT repeat protein
MSVLVLIWWTTVVLAGLSLAAMTGLIIHRARSNRRERRDAVRRKEVQQLALRLIYHPQRLFEVEKELRPQDRRLLLQVYEELLPKIRGEYADRLVNLMRTLGLMDECVRQLRDPSWWTRAQACRALGAFRDPNIVLALYRAIEDPALQVRIEAARSLARLGAVRSVVELVEQLMAGDELPSVPILDLFRSLGRRAVPELLGLLNGDVGVAARIVAADALGHIGDLTAVPALLHLYDHPSEHVRLTALQALGRLSDPRALPAVLLAMTDPSWEVRGQAAAAAGRIGAVESVALLQRLLEDDHWWVRYYSAEALFRIGEEGVAALRMVASGDHPNAAQMAAGLLHEKGVAA